MRENPKYHEIDIPEVNVTHYIPRELMFCLGSDFVHLNELLFALAAGKIDYETFRVQAICRIMKLSPGYPKKLNILDREAYFGNLYMLSELIDDFFEKKEDGKQILKLSYGENPIPKIAPIFKKYYGPKDFLIDITFGQYLDAINIYVDFVETKDTYLLYMLLAVFYLRKNESYNPKKLKARAKKFTKFPVGYAYACFHLFGALQVYLNSGLVYIEGNEIDFSILYKDVKRKGDIKSTIPGLGMRGVALDIAESNSFGPYNQVREALFLDIILALYKLKKQGLDEIEREKRNK